MFVFNSRLWLMPGKLRSKWMGPYEVLRTIDYGVVELKNGDGTFRVNVHRLKPYFEKEKEEKGVLSISLFDP